MSALTLDICNNSFIIDNFKLGPKRFFHHHNVKLKLTDVIFISDKHHWENPDLEMHCQSKLMKRQLRVQQRNMEEWALQKDE